MDWKCIAPLCGACLFTAAQASGTFGGIGLVVAEAYNGLGVETVVPNTPAEKSGLKVGDVILAVNDNDLAEIGFDEGVGLFRGEKDDPVEITYARSGDTLGTTLRRVAMTTSPLPSLYAPAENIKGLEHVSNVGLGEEFFAVYLEKSSSRAQKDSRGAKDRANGIRLLQIQNNIISYENEASGKTRSTDLNGKTHNNKEEH